MDIEVARLLALCSIFDIPMSHRRSGMHPGIDPELRQQCDYELFASPLNAVVGNGYYASKWPQIEWRFGSMGSYPSAILEMPDNSIVGVSPPYTDAYLADVMERLPQMKVRFQLRTVIQLRSAPWRESVASLLPSAQLLYDYYDASADVWVKVVCPTLLWEDPRLKLQEALVPVGCASSDQRAVLHHRGAASQREEKSDTVRRSTKRVSWRWYVCVSFIWGSCFWKSQCSHCRGGRRSAEMSSCGGPEA